MMENWQEISDWYVALTPFLIMAAFVIGYNQGRKDDER